ncbi:32144_t:CDS:2, partial [Gigaspora margarita]
KNKSAKESEENDTNASPNKVIGDAGFHNMSSKITNLKKAKARNKMSGVMRDC